MTTTTTRLTDALDAVREIASKLGLSLTSSKRQGYWVVSCTVPLNESQSLTLAAKKDRAWSYAQAPKGWEDKPEPAVDAITIDAGRLFGRQWTRRFPLRTDGTFNLRGIKTALTTAIADAKAHRISEARSEELRRQRETARGNARTVILDAYPGLFEEDWRSRGDLLVPTDEGDASICVDLRSDGSVDLLARGISVQRALFILSRLGAFEREQEGGDDE